MPRSLGSHRPLFLETHHPGAQSSDLSLWSQGLPFVQFLATELTKKKKKKSCYTLENTFKYEPTSNSDKPSRDYPHSPKDPISMQKLH